jgi:hypothetical protein
MYEVFSVCCIFTGCRLVTASNAVAFSASMFTPYWLVTLSQFTQCSNWLNPILAAISHQPTLLTAVSRLKISQSQSYFTTGGLPPINSSWHRAPWDSRPEFFNQLSTCGHNPYIKLSLTIGRLCHLQLLLVLVSAFILGFESRGTRNHILLSQIRDFPFCRLLRLAGLRWRHSTPPPREKRLVIAAASPYIASARTALNTLPNSSSIFACVSVAAIA